MSQLATIDLVIIFSYFAISLGIGLSFSKRASKNIKEYFVSGRNLPWWIIGTSMVATTFASDTPLAVTGIIAKDGIAGNWLWWSFLMAQVTATFFFAPLWRRSEVITEAELNEIRYEGKLGATLQLLRAVHVGVIQNCVTLGFVILGMSKAVDAGFGLPKETAILICVAMVLGYSIFSGFWGVVVTDLLQFGLAMVGAILFAKFAISEVGGIASLKDQLQNIYGNADQILAFIPSIDSEFMPLSTFLVYIFIQWWADHKVIGGGYLVQRMAASKDESHAAKGTLWFVIAHYALRPWPWIIVGLCSMVVFPNLADAEQGYPQLMFKILPAGVLGLLLTSFLAAFMSTVDTHLNMGASFLINDIYRRFLKPEASAKHYVAAARVATVLLMVIAAGASFYMTSISEMWKFLVMLEAGIGPLYVAKWYWWRVNAWSEISAMLSSLILSVTLSIVSNWSYQFKLVVILSVTTVIWITVTLLTRPVSEKTLSQFFQKVKPWSRFWGPIAEKNPNVQTARPFQIGLRLMCWAATVAMIYTLLFGIGHLILQRYNVAMLTLSITLVCGTFLFTRLRRL